MKPRNSVLALLFFLLLTPGVFAQYDAQTKNNLSVNDVYAFVYHWFAGFDRQQDDAYFLQYLPDGKIDMQFPDFPIRSTVDFKRWYGNVKDTVQWNSHEIKNLRVEGKGLNQWNVTYHVLWKARTYEGETLEMETSQQMLIDTGHGVKVLRHRAQEVKK